MVSSSLENRIQDTFIKLARKIPLEEIDVSKLCNVLKITRQTFYYHYKNIYDLILSIYINKRLVATNLASIKEIIKEFVFFLYKDEMFNKEVADSNAFQALKDFSFSYFFQSFSLFLNKYESIDSYTKRKIAKYLSFSISDLILDLFIDSNYDETKIINECLLFINEKIIGNIVINFKSNK